LVAERSICRPAWRQHAQAPAFKVDLPLDVIRDAVNKGRNFSELVSVCLAEGLPKVSAMSAEDFKRAVDETRLTVVSGAD
jgi:hypothetical protein